MLAGGAEVEWPWDGAGEANAPTLAPSCIEPSRLKDPIVYPSDPDCLDMGQTVSIAHEIAPTSHHLYA
jgi:hypothetical protein